VGSTVGGVAVSSPLAVLLESDLSVDLPPADFAVLEPVVDLPSDVASEVLPDLVDELVLEPASRWEGSDWVALLLLVESEVEEAVLGLLRVEAVLDELGLLERCGAACGPDDCVNEGSAVAASTIAAKLSPSCEGSDWLGFGVGA
jgi:hypothetical protein